VEAQSIVEDIERQLDDGAIPETDGMRYELLALRLAILVIQDDTSAALELDSLCLERVSRQKHDAELDTWKDEAVLNCLIYCYEKAGNMEKARSLEHLHPPAANLLTLSYRASVLSACDVREGHLVDGARRLREALTESEIQAGRRSGAASLLAGSLARIHYEWNDLDTVEELLADRLDVIEDACYVDAVQSAYISLARIWVVRGDLHAAHELLDRAEAVGNRRAWLRLLSACAAERTRLWLLENRTVDAERSALQLELVAKRQSDKAHGENCDIANLVHLTHARLLLHKHAYVDAVALLKRAMSSKEAASNQYAMAKFKVLLAVAHDGSGDRAASLACLADVLKFGETANLVRLVADEKDFVARLIEALPASGQALSQASDYRQRLWQALDLDLPKPSSPVSPTTNAVTETLSKREQDILGLVTKGLANKQIARTLLITPETVKWHLKNVYSKLGVSGRTLAAHRARQMELIRE
jgi:LuxR family maltose regulon positive regulatory protein